MRPLSPLPADRTRTRSMLRSLLVPLALLAGSAQAQDAGPRIRPLQPPTAMPGASGPGMPPPPRDPADEAEAGEDDEAGASRDAGERAEPDKPAEPEARGLGGPRQRPPVATGADKINLDMVDTPLSDVVKFMAEITGRNFILTDDLKGEITIISHQPVTVGEAYEAFLSALEMAGYTTVTVGKATKVVPNGDAASSPTRVYEGGTIPYTDNYVTQIIQLENVSVSDVSSVVKELAGKGAKVIAYAPTNTLIITDAATNIRRVYRIVSQLDVAAPKAKLEIVPLQYATAEDIAKIIKEVYGVASDSSSSSSSSSRDSRRNRRSRRNRHEPEPKPEASSTKVGKEGSYIEKIISDERTNSLVILANEEALEAVKQLIAQLDIDVDPASRAQIHVVYLEHAKAEDVAQVLANLSESGSSSSSSRNSRNSRNNRNARNNRRQPPGGPGGPFGPEGGADGEGGSAVAAFDSGVRITSDENTNSLVIIATPDQFRIIQQVIEKLDIRRKQVFVEAVILELGNEDTDEFGLGVHAGSVTDDGGLSLYSAQLNGSSIGLSTDTLSGLAMGIFGPTIGVGVDTNGDGVVGDGETLTVPAFGVALNALQSNSAVNILSTPNILTMDNEEAKIVVGRNIPFPISTSRDNNNNPIVSYQREDVAITLKVTPQINESNYVTLEVFQEVQEIEEDSQGLDVNSAGFITSKRSVESTVVVRDNQTVVIGGLIGETDTAVETKVPILGDLPLVGRLFRGQRNVTRKTNLLVFLTPHVIDEPADLEEVYRVKWAQRKAFIERFYGKSREQQEQELAHLLSYSMNVVDEPSRYRGPKADEKRFDVIDSTTGPVDAPPADPLDQDPPTP